jgi:hypothetical protein
VSLVIRGKYARNVHGSGIADLRPWNQGETHVLDIDTVQNEKGNVVAAYPEFGAMNGVRTNSVHLIGKRWNTHGSLLSGGTEANLGAVYITVDQVDAGGAFVAHYNDSTSPGFGQRFYFRNCTLRQNGTNNGPAFRVGWPTGLVSQAYRDLHEVSLQDCRVEMSGTNTVFAFLDPYLSQPTNGGRVVLINSEVRHTGALFSFDARYTNEAVAHNSRATTPAGLNIALTGSIEPLVPASAPNTNMVVLDARQTNDLTARTVTVTARLQTSGAAQTAGVGLVTQIGGTNYQIAHAQFTAPTADAVNEYRTISARVPAGAVWYVTNLSSGGTATIHAMSQQ